MREIASEQITAVIRRLCIQANCILPEDVRARIAACAQEEPWPQAQEILEQITQNYTVAQERM